MTELNPFITVLTSLWICSGSLNPWRRMLKLIVILGWLEHKIENGVHWGSNITLKDSPSP